MQRAVLIAIHDVAPATLTECRALLQWVHDIDAHAPVTLLCVPQFHGGTTLTESVATRSWIDACTARGAEVALHGYTHRDAGPAPVNAGEWWQRRMLTAREGEFSTLHAEHARERIERGLAMLGRCGWRVAGFVPPAWRMNGGLLGALSACGLDYCTDMAGFHRLADGSRIGVPVIGTSARSYWRCVVSRVWLTAMLRTTAATECVRVALHPADARDTGLRNAWQRALDRLLQTRRPLTKGRWLQGQSNSVDSVRSR